MLKVIAVIEGEEAKKLPRKVGRRIKDKVFLPCRYKTNSEGRIHVQDQKILDHCGVKPAYFLVNFTRIKDTSKGFAVIVVGEGAKSLKPYYSDNRIEKYNVRYGYTIFVHISGQVSIRNFGLPVQNQVPYFREDEIFKDKLPLEWGEEAVRAVLSEKFQPFLAAIMAAYKELTPNGATLPNGIHISRSRKKQ